MTTANDLARIATATRSCGHQGGRRVFFNGHVLHRSRPTSRRSRYAGVRQPLLQRALVHAMGRGLAPERPARVAAVDPITRMTNGSHILARGDTHLPFARPRVGRLSHDAAVAEERRRQSAFAARRWPTWTTA
jgi:hypothetical protein